MNGSRTVTASSRGRGRVVRNPSNVTARLAEVEGGNGTHEGSCAPENSCSGCFRLGIELQALLGSGKSREKLGIRLITRASSVVCLSHELLMHK
ncbi:hypothetical protein CRG98_004410 [Punica granatum]|uniref:Uncharacterized protein n=1 Tax=Punica granatum TaxID=22663 RepID=A0A2I0L4W7_PUNGR|nr:hypothetical protein CRG98_004410 [Punica granatum]